MQILAVKLTLLLLIAAVQSQLAIDTQMSSCKVSLNNGIVVDLSQYDKAPNPGFQVFSEYNYTFNPCTKINCKNARLDDSAVCQAPSDPRHWGPYSLGTQSTAKFEINNNQNLVLMFSNGDLTEPHNEERASRIEILCADSNEFKFKSVGSSAGKHFYYFTLSTPAACLTTTPRKTRTTTKFNRLTISKTVFKPTTTVISNEGLVTKDDSQRPGMTSSGPVAAVSSATPTVSTLYALNVHLVGAACLLLIQFCM